MQDNNLLSGLRHAVDVSDEDYCLPEPMRVNEDDYHGRLLLLPGHHELHRFNVDLSKWTPQESSGAGAPYFLGEYTQHKAATQKQRTGTSLTHVGLF